MTDPINLTQLRAITYPSPTNVTAIPNDTLLALIDTAEAARQLTDALDDAIKAHVNDHACWTQADYDNWHNARNLGETNLARFDFTTE